MLVKSELGTKMEGVVSTLKDEIRIQNGLAN